MSNLLFRKAFNHPEIKITGGKAFLPLYTQGKNNHDPLGLKKLQVRDFSSVLLLLRFLARFCPDCS